MRILLVAINFTPELTGCGKYTGEMSSWLAKKGHVVHVITAPPYYPQWKIHSIYKNWYRKETINYHDAGSLIVYRCPIWVPKRPGGIKRLIHLLSFAISSLPILFGFIFKKTDIVLTIEPTLFSAPGSLIWSKLKKTKSWLHIQDYEVDAAFDMGIVKSDVAHKMALTFERGLLKRFDFVSTISSKMIERLSGKGVDKDKQYLFPNWADIQSIKPLNTPSKFREQLSLNSDDVVVLYSGNLGEKQGLEILVEAARNTEVYSQIVWVIAGEGGAQHRLAKLSEDLVNIVWLPLQPLELLNELLNLADIHVLPQKEEAADLVMPSKLTGMLASGRPVVATAAPNTQVAQVVSDCGVVVPPGDSNALANAVFELSKTPEKRTVLGNKARKYAEKNLNYEVIMSNFEKALTSLVSEVSDPK